MVGTQNTALRELKGVVEKLKLDSAAKQEVFVKTVEKVTKAVDGVKEKSSNIEKVNIVGHRPL